MENEKQIENQTSKYGNNQRLRGKLKKHSTINLIGKKYHHHVLT